MATSLRYIDTQQGRSLLDPEEVIKKAGGKFSAGKDAMAFIEITLPANPSQEVIDAANYLVKHGTRIKLKE